MSNSSGLSNVFKRNALGAHLNSHTLKAALYAPSASISPSTSVYTTTGEVVGTGYTAGGVVVTNGTASLDTGVGIWTPGVAFSWTGATITSTDCVLLYDVTNSNAAVGVFTFGAAGVTAGTFALNMPTNSAAAALVRIS